MRLRGSARPIADRRRFERDFALGVLYLLAGFAAQAMAQDPSPVAAANDRLHQTQQWAEIEKHLPDPATATARELETQGDILRARRFTEDAFDYYKYALARGGSGSSLLNKLGLTELEMRNNALARAYFQRAVKLSSKDAQAWNNLGAVEYLDGDSAGAVSDYKRAVKLDKRQAVFHANLATAYFERNDSGSARREIASALRIDPKIFEPERAGIGGVAAHVLSSQDRARFSIEMAKLYARDGLEEQMLHSLARASEAGMDVQREMRRDPVLAKFEMDPRVLVLVHNAAALRAGRPGSGDAGGDGGAPALTDAKPL